uniref:Secreted protein n=1 Tax=Macrostomum lignano TaxID=282301 RepID=A0A1I8J8F0_9PLAT
VVPVGAVELANRPPVLVVPVGAVELANRPPVLAVPAGAVELANRPPVLAVVAAAEVPNKPPVPGAADALVVFPENRPAVLEVALVAEVVDEETMPAVGAAAAVGLDTTALALAVTGVDNRPPVTGAAVAVGLETAAPVLAVTGVDNNPPVPGALVVVGGIDKRPPMVLVLVGALLALVKADGTAVVAAGADSRAPRLEGFAAADTAPGAAKIPAVGVPDTEEATGTLKGPLVDPTEDWEVGTAAGCCDSRPTMQSTLVNLACSAVVVAVVGVEQPLTPLPPASELGDPEAVDFDTDELFLPFGVTSGAGGSLVSDAADVVSERRFDRCPRASGEVTEVKDACSNSRSSSLSRLAAEAVPRTPEALELDDAADRSLPAVACRAASTRRAAKRFMSWSMASSCC